MPKIDIAKVPERKGSLYPAPFDKPCDARVRKQFGDAAGLTDFGVNLLRLPPGVWSSQRHWHDREDERVYVLAGEVALVTDEGETLLKVRRLRRLPEGRSRRPPPHQPQRCPTRSSSKSARARRTTRRSIPTST